MMSEAKKRVPKRRFKEFLNAGDWEQRKLISLYKTIRNAFVGTATPYYTNDSINGYFYLESNNVKNGAINRNNEIYITKDFYEKQEDKWLYKDDIVIVQSGHVGHTAVIPEELDKTAAHALIMLQNKKENFDSHFINNSFQTPFIRNKIDEITTGNTIKHILASDVKNIVIKIPSFKEQKLISQLFKLLDLNITLHQRKLDKLQATKKALLQEMFPKEGQDKPKRRFKGFTDAWEQRKLSDVADVRDGTHDSPKFYNDGFPLVTSKNLKGGSIDFSDCSFISEQDFNEINKRSKVDPGDILFGMIGTIGNPAIVEHTGFAIKNVALIKEGNIINNRFIYHLLSSKVFENYIARENAGGTQKFIALNQIRNFDFLAPTLVEQSKIIELLDCISQNINLHQRKLDKLKNLKQAYLNEMFV